MQMIKKDASVEGSFYIAPVLNELVLGGGDLGVYPVANENYHSFYSPMKIKDFETRSSG